MITLYLTPSQKIIDVTEEQKNKLVDLDLVWFDGKNWIGLECSELTEFFFKINTKIAILNDMTLKEELIDHLLNNLKYDVINGDLTVLEELLGFIDNKHLIEALPEEEWVKYKKLRKY